MKNHLIKLLFLIIFFILTNSLVASLDISHPLTIAELIDIALDNNPSTRQNWWTANRAASELGRSKSAYYPTVELDSNAKNGKDFKFINGPNTDYTVVGADLVLSMMLYDFGERNANVNAAKMALVAANWQVDWNMQKVIVQVLQNAYSTLNAQESYQAACSSLEDAEKVLHSAREVNRVGLVPISDVYTSQATLSRMNMDLSERRALLDIEKGKLAASLGLPANISLELATLDSIQSPPCQQTNELMDLALSQRGDLMEKRAKLREASYNKDKARAGYGPKVSMSGRGGTNHSFHDKTSGGQYEISLNLNIPLFKGFDTVYQNCIAYSNAKLAMEDLAQLQLDILLEVQKYSRSLQAAQEMLPYADENLKSSIQAYESVLHRYQAGKERITEVSNAQQQLAAARIRYSEVKMRWLVAVANLAYSTGTLTPLIKTP